MAQQIINVGTTLNDGTGDDLRDAFVKVNNNFLELYTGGISGSNLRIINNTISTYQGNIYLTPVGSNPVVVGQTNPLVVSNSTVSTSSITGALIVSGGAGIGGSLNVGQNIQTPTVNATSLYGDNFYYTNGQPFVSSAYSDANVAAYFNSYNGNLGAANFNATSAIFSPGYFYSNGLAFVGGGTSSGLNIMDGGSASTVFDFTDNIIDGGGA
jgi:hypothetical protein